MGRKLFVRIFNILYLAAAGFAVFSFVTKPVVSLTLGVHLTEEQVASIIPAEGEEGTKIKRDETPDLKSMLTPAKIASAVGAFDKNFIVEVPASKMFEFNNPNVLKDIITENLERIKSSVADLFGEKLPGLIKEITTEFASSAMTEQINQEIANYFTGEGDAPQVDPEQVQEIVNNVYELLDNNETTTVSELTDTLMGSASYVLADPQPTSETFGAKVYYVKLGEGETATYSKATEYNASATYYTATYDAGVLGVLSDLQDQGVEGFENIDLDTVDPEEIQDKMVEALGEIPGLTSKTYKVAETQPTATTDFSIEVYYIPGAEEGTYVRATSYQEGMTYYVEEVVINNLNDALIGLLSQFLNGNKEESGENAEEPEKAFRMVREGGSEEKSQEEQIHDLVIELINTLLPIDIESMDLTFGGYAQYVLIAVVGLACVPWGLFALVTFIRTLRPKKCWTKPWIVFVFAFTELILGVGLTYGMKFGLPLVKPLIEGLLPANLATVLSGLSVDIMFSAFIPSIIYLAFIPMTIIYAIFAHKVKVQYKEDKQAKRLAKRNA